MYVQELWIVSFFFLLTVPISECNLTVSCSKDATTAMLHCFFSTVNSSNELDHAFYDARGGNISISSSSNIAYCNVTPGVEFTVGCTAYNGINYGQDTYTNQTTTCTFGKYT